MMVEELRKMYLERFNGVEIFRPRLTSELEIEAASESHLRSKFAVKKYVSRDEVNSIIQHQFSFYSGILGELLPPLASRHLMEFLLHEYDQYAIITQRHQAGLLSEEESVKWMELGSILRRAVKYLAERVVLLHPDEAPQADETLLLTNAEKVWICAEEMVRLYVMSDQTFSIFPDHTIFEVLPPGGSQYFIQELSEGCPDIQNIPERMRFDAANRKRFVPSQPDVFNIDEQDRVIGEAFKDTVGVTYREALGILAEIINGAQPKPMGFEIPFIHKANVIAQVADHLKLPLEAVERVVAGFSVSKEQMESEGREIWKPKQEYRAYRRGFSEFPHPTGHHLVFSKTMAGESHYALTKDAVFKQFPAEWRSKVVNQALDKLSNTAGAWFEKVVEDNLKAINFIGKRAAKDGLGAKGERITIPPDVGEIDFIGYSVPEKILIVVECKLVRDSSEPKFFRDDIDDFVFDPKKSYIKKFRKKFRWVQDNLPTVCRALSSVLSSKIEIVPEYIAGAMVTFLPTVASSFIEDFPCVSITELMLDYESTNRWPYETGIFSA
jgi:hypothetical protein